MRIAKQLVRSVAGPLRRIVRRFRAADRSFIGAHGCLHTAASFIAWNQVEGDYLEFGVYEGDSFAAAYWAIERNRRRLPSSSSDAAEYRRWRAASPRLFAFDSFAGLPAGEAERHADYAPGAYGCSESRFLANLRWSGVDLRRVVTVPGFYDRTLTPELKRQRGLSRAALVMIDCDLYESTVPVLEFLTDLVGQGTVLIFHDWFRYQGNPRCGEQRACREWLARNPQLELIEYWREGPQAVSFIVNLK